MPIMIWERKQGEEKLCKLREKGLFNKPIKFKIYFQNFIENCQ